MSWLSSETTTRSNLQTALLERRLRTEADSVRMPLPEGLQRRTLNALQEIKPNRRTIDFFRQPSMVTSLTGMVTLVVLVVLVSLNQSVRPAPDVTPTLTRTLSVPTLKSMQEDVLDSLRAFRISTGMSVGDASVTDQFQQEAKFLMHDASRATNAILASMPKRLLPVGDPLPLSPNDT